MIRKNKDSKFVIYQVLYIFVVAVLAIKGADLDLGEVISKREAVTSSVRDSLITVIDSLNRLGLKFDLKIDTTSAEENIKLKEKIRELNLNMASLNKQIRELPPPETIKEEVIPVKEEPVVEETTSPLSESQIFIRNTWNMAKNTGRTNVTILDPKTRKTLASIKPGQQIKFDIGSQEQVIMKYGSREEMIEVKPNKPPELKIESASSKMNASDVYVQELQRTTIFRVTVIDERPEQIDVTYNGPISVTGPVKDSKGNLIYNVSLRIANTEQRFDDWMDKFNPLKERDGRYKVNFFFIAADKKTKDRVQVGDSFYFTDFAR